MSDVYLKLAGHLAELTMGYPYSEALLDLLREMFTPDEAEIALAMATDMLPLQVEETEAIARRAGRPESDVSAMLQKMAGKYSVFEGPAPSGRMGYALHQVGYGMPQSYLWSGLSEKTSPKMAKLLIKYFTVPVTSEVYGKAPTKTYKYSPAGLAVDVPKQSVLPQERIRTIIESAGSIGLAHCPCRTSARVLGRTDCTHSLEVCFKYDDMAEFVIDKGLARRVSADEAMHIMTECEKEGLVHMVDNAKGGIMHTCNCCGHYCWNVGIIARKKIPRDSLMAVYYLRETELEECIGCGACSEICPVNAVTMNDDDRPVVDLDWCIGCGVCMAACPTDVITMVRRHDDPGPEDFTDLNQKIKNRA